MTEPNALAVQTPQAQALEPIAMIQQALTQGTSPDVIRELVALQQSMERFNWARVDGKLQQVSAEVYARIYGVTV